MSKVRTRKLWLRVYFQAPKAVSRERVIKTLIRSVRRGDYELPRRWRAVIEWRNKADAPPRRGEWQAELYQSANDPEHGSSGFETAVIRYLEGQL